jgi:hypothetical protein
MECVNNFDFVINKPLVVCELKLLLFEDDDDDVVVIFLIDAVIDDDVVTISMNLLFTWEVCDFPSILFITELVLDVYLGIYGKFISKMKIL